MARTMQGHPSTPYLVRAIESLAAAVAVEIADGDPRRSVRINEIAEALHAFATSDDDPADGH